MGLTQVIGFFLIVIIIGGLYYTYYFFNPTLLNDGETINIDNKSRSGSKQLVIGVKEFEQPEAIRYFYDGWFRVNTTEDLGKQYVIFNRGKEFILTLVGHKLSIIYSGKASASVNESVNESSGILQPVGSNEDPHTTIIDISTHFPFQKWVYMCINVDENTVDVYLNGKLVKSVSNPKTAGGTAISLSTANKDSPITIGNIGVKGKIVRFRREPRLMDPQSVWNVYIQGPGVTDEDDSATGEYHGRLELTRHNFSRRKFNIF
jgi:hypothetical protein